MVNEIFEKIMSYVLPIGGGVTVGAFLILIAKAVVKKYVGKLFDKLNVEQIEEKAVDKGVERVKAVVMQHDIAPLVTSELQKYTEEANKYTENQIADMRQDIKNLLAVLESGFAYFDNSIGVSESQKELLKEAIDKAKGSVITDKQLATSEVIVENKKTAHGSNKAVTSDNGVVR